MYSRCLPPHLFFSNITFATWFSLFRYQTYTIISPLLPHLSFPTLELMESRKEHRAAMPRNSPLDVFTRVLYLTAPSLLPGRWVNHLSSHPSTPQSRFCHLDWTHEHERPLPAIISLFMHCYVATGAHHHVTKQDTATLQRRQMTKWNMLMRKESSQGCTAPPRRLDWTKAQALVLTSWLPCLSYTWDIIETAVCHSVNGTVVYETPLQPARTGSTCQPCSWLLCLFLSNSCTNGLKTFNLSSQTMNLLFKVLQADWHPFNLALSAVHLFWLMKQISERSLFAHLRSSALQLSGLWATLPGSVQFSVSAQPAVKHMNTSVSCQLTKPDQQNFGGTQLLPLKASSLQFTFYYMNYSQDQPLGKWSIFHTQVTWDADLLQMSLNTDLIPHAGGNRPSASFSSSPRALPKPEMKVEDNAPPGSSWHKGLSQNAGNM